MTSAVFVCRNASTICTICTCDSNIDYDNDFKYPYHLVNVYSVSVGVIDII